MSRALALAALALAGCSVLHQPRLGPEADAWTTARARYTQGAKLYDRFETHAIATATWQVPEVRARRVDQVAAWKAMTASERQALAAREREEGARWQEFLLVFFTSDARDNDLDARDTVWRVALLREGQPERLPAEVKVVRVDSLLRDLYPSIHEYDTVYRIRFARKDGDADGAATLRIAGSEGRMDFVFP